MSRCWTKFVRILGAVDTHIRLTLALGEIEKALSMMRRRVLPGAFVHDDAIAS